MLKPTFFNLSKYQSSKLYSPHVFITEIKLIVLLVQLNNNAANVQSYCRAGNQLNVSCFSTRAAVALTQFMVCVYYPIT